MGCGQKNKTNNCIADTLLAIAEAQDSVCGPDSCTSGCNRSIDELLGNVAQTSNYDTVPFMLTCKSSCLPYIGIGARRINQCEREFGHSIVFRVNDVDPETNCAVIELLQFQPITADREGLLNNATTNLVRSGSCITVDLDDFSSISCLPAINLSNGC